MSTVLTVRRQRVRCVNRRCRQIVLVEILGGERIDPGTYKCPDCRKVDGGLEELEKLLAMEAQLRLRLEPPS